MNQWKKYTNGRVILEDPAGFFVIKPEDMEKGQPLTCPLCEMIMRTTYDDESYEKFECCDRCAQTWARRNQEKWSTGWRPSHDEIINKFGER